MALLTLTTDFGTADHFTGAMKGVIASLAPGVPIIDITHELLRNVLLNANADYTRADFEGTSRSDDIFGLGAGVTYLINRNFSVDATYRWSKRESDDNAAEYTRNIVVLGVTARL